MKSIDLTKLIEGLLVIIALAVVTGQYGTLRKFAAREAAVSLHGWGTHAFFPATYRQITSPTPKGGVHLKGAMHSNSSPHSDQLNQINKEIYCKSN
jgi:hypothetical protein